MSMAYTNRVYLPDGSKIYCTDDQYGDDRLEQIYKEHGNCKVEWCEKIWGQSLDDAPAKWSGTIEEMFS